MKNHLSLSLLLILSFIGGVTLLTRNYLLLKPQWVNVKVNQLPGWNEINHAKSLVTLQKSCRVMLKQSPDKTLKIGAETLKMKAWFPICQTALHQNPAEAKSFFEQNFKLKTWRDIHHGLVTGYYSPSYVGRLKPDQTFRYPVYAKPQDLITLKLQDFSPESPNQILYGKLRDKQMIPYDSRADINQGSLKGRAQVLAWLQNPMDALDLEIQGAGIIETPEKKLVLNYAGQNGHSYQALGRILIDKGLMHKKDVTMNHIREFFNQHPEQVLPLFALNPSFVFFKIVKDLKFLGAQNINLSPGYSMAVDPKYIALGTPIYISSTLPHQGQWQRLLVAQDVGGAIKGKMRGDVYWGRGLHAKHLASDMKQKGKFWYFIPKT